MVGVSAWYLLKRRERQMATRSIAVASLFGLVASLVTAYSGDRSGAIVARLQPMKLAAMEALYDGCEGAPLTAVGILRPESQRTSDDDAFYFKVDIPKMLSIMSFRDAEAYVAGINDLLRGNPEQGILPAEEKIARGRVAIDELARFRDARQSGDQETVDQITRKFDPSTPEGREFLGEYFAYFGYGYLQSPEQLVPNIPLLFYSFRVMVGAGCLFILAGRMDRGRGRTPAVGHSGPDARGRRRIEAPGRVGGHHLLHLPGALHGAAHRRAEHPLPSNQGGTRQGVTLRTPARQAQRPDNHACTLHPGGRNRTNQTTTPKHVIRTTLWTR